MRILDLFSGGGGVGAAVDLLNTHPDPRHRLPGVEVAWAANHWALAVEHHARRHPRTAVVCQDLCQFDFRRAPDCDGIWASSACQGHSEAAQPARALDPTLAAAHDSLRSTAWAVISAVLAKQPKWFVVENVREFVEWAPSPLELASFGSRREAEREAIARRRDTADEIRVVRASKGGARWAVVRVFEKGSLYRHWLNLFRLAGYRVTEQVTNAVKWSTGYRAAPQRRRRLIIVGHLDREVTIREPKLAVDPTLEPVLDFDAGDWTPISDMDKPGARERAEAADKLFAGAPCWGYHVSHRGAWARGLDQPSTTITTQNHHYAVHRGRYRLWTVPETAQVMGFPPDYFDGLPRSKALIMAGNAICPPMGAGVIKQVAEATR